MSRTFIGRPEMLCAHVHWSRHWSEPLIDFAFRVLTGKRNHCADSADWEARQGRTPDYLDRLRRDWL